MRNWTKGYIHGPREALIQWELETWPPPPAYDEENNLVPPTKSARPHEAFRGPAIGVLIESDYRDDPETGETYPVYTLDPDRDDVLVCFSVRATKLHHLDALDALEGVTVYRNATLATIRAELPEFAVGQAIPHIP